MQLTNLFRTFFVALKYNICYGFQTEMFTEIFYLQWYDLQFCKPICSSEALHNLWLDTLISYPFWDEHWCTEIGFAALYDGHSLFHDCGFNAYILLTKLLKLNMWNIKQISWKLLYWFSFQKQCVLKDVIFAVKRIANNIFFKQLLVHVYLFVLFKCYLCIGL